MKRSLNSQQLMTVLDHEASLSILKGKLEHSFMVVERQNGKDVPMYQLKMTQGEMATLYQMVACELVHLYQDHGEELSQVSQGTA